VRIAAFMLVLCAAAAAFDAGARVALLEKSLLAPCCYKEPISRHQSEVSTKMKLEIARWVEEGKSDAEILSIYRARYGDRVVTTPEKPPSAWVQGFPWLAGLAGAGLVVQLLRKWVRKGVAAGGEARVAVTK
jgi:cytochrome c-type biogenesis protein CcmH/NrfF